MLSVCTICFSSGFKIFSRNFNFSGDALWMFFFTRLSFLHFNYNSIFFLQIPQNSHFFSGKFLILGQAYLIIIKIIVFLCLFRVLRQNFSTICFLWVRRNLSTLRIFSGYFLDIEFFSACKLFLDNFSAFRIFSSNF